MACQRIYCLNALTLQLAREDQAYAQILARAELTVADGVGAAWAIRRITGRAVERVAGIDLMQDLCAVCAQEGQRVFLLGGEEGVAARAAQRLQLQFPDLQVAGTRNGFWDAAEEAGIVEDINRAGTDLLLVGLGQPRQEFFLDRQGDRLRSRMALGVGGSFDVVAGRLRRAPEWIQKLGGEWLFRLAQEPWRIRRIVRLLGFFGWVIASGPKSKMVEK